MTDLERLRQLVIEACQHPAGSPQRQRCLTQVICLTSPHLWREATPDYADALQQTWVYFCQNVCDRGSGDRYDPDRSSVITWLNTYLKRRLQDFYIARQRQQALQSPSQKIMGETGNRLDPIEQIAAPPDIPPILAQVQLWVEQDPTGELCQTHIQGRPDLTCQVLILRRLPPETSWKDLAAEWGVPIPTLSSFYQRQCMPRLRKFGEQEGYV